MSTGASDGACRRPSVCAGARRACCLQRVTLCASTAEREQLRGRAERASRVRACSPPILYKESVGVSVEHECVAHECELTVGTENACKAHEQKEQSRAERRERRHECTSAVTGEHATAPLRSPGDGESVRVCVCVCVCCSARPVQPRGSEELLARCRWRLSARTHEGSH